MNRATSLLATVSAALIVIFIVQCDEGDVAVLDPPLPSVALTASPASGIAPLVIDLTVELNVATAGNVEFGFDCTSDGIMEASMRSESNRLTAVGVCRYQEPGTFRVKVVVTGTGASLEGFTTVVVSDAVPSVPDAVIVSMDDDFFFSADITVQPGTTITWQNVGNRPHTSTSDTGIWDSGTVNPGGSWSWTVPADAASGTVFPYYCIFHGAPGGIGMVGIIRIPTTDGSPPPPSPSPPPSPPPAPPPPPPPGTVVVSMDDDFFSSADITVQPGTTITWQNIGNRPHTSTSDTGIWDSGTVNTGGSWSWTVPADTALGTVFPYYCVFHGAPGGQGMAGVIRIPSDGSPPLPPPPPPPPPGGTVVQMQDDFFSSRDITVQPGTTITWQNVGNRPHTSTSDTGIWDSGTVNPGQSWSWTVPADAQSGTSFPYFCIFHGDPGGQGMAGVIRVEANAPPPPPGSVTVTTPGLTFDPERVEIPPGGVVTWQFSETTHNVTFEDEAPPDGNILDSLPGTSVSRTFPAPGDYDYICTLHDDQKGRVRVR